MKILFAFPSLNYILSFFICLLFPISVFSQQTISGIVTEKNGTPILGANVYLDGTYDGATSDIDGVFSFTTTEIGIQTLIVSYVSFEDYALTKDVTQLQNLKIVLKEDVSSLETVVVSAGSFEASDNSKVSVLKPLDVVTTASALGDFVGALQTLPGTTTVAEDGRLFVRGGDASETQIFIDGIRVFTPYTPTTANTPTRGRYSPFLFDGITFSTGGYSAEYGQALSSILLLNTIDEPVQEKTDISIMSVGLGLGNTQKWEKSSLSVNASYINLAPYIAILPDRNEWEKPFETFSGETVYRYKTKEGLFKAYAAFDRSNFELTLEDINVPQGIDFELNNNNFYANTSYQTRLSDKWRLKVGGSYTYAINKTNIDNTAIEQVEKSAHVKATLTKRFSKKFKLNFGAEQFLTDVNENFDIPFAVGQTAFDSNISAAYTEAAIIFSRKLALKAGIRAEYGSLYDEFTVAPRVSMAYKTGANSQLSVAYGDFFQQPDNAISLYYDDGVAQNTKHFIANYQYTANDRIFRAEVFRKEYRDLVTFTGDNNIPGFDSQFSNNGEGFAQGIDFFFRDNQSIKNVDYWVSYSLLDSERQYRNYPTKAVPPFANTHNISVVGKYWIDDWKSQVGFSYQHASGRTFTNPNLDGFLNDQTKSFNNISVNWAYLISQQKILYFSINNVTNFKNINGFQYANTPSADGSFARRALRPATDQFFFVGFFWTISDDKTENQLDKL